MDFQSSGLIQFLPVMVFSGSIAILGFMLAREKERNVVLWTVLGLIPVLNLLCLWFFLGATNLRLERKIDQLLAARPQP